MKRTVLSQIIVLSVFLTAGLCLADRALEAEKIDEILKLLTDHPRTTWIDSGTVKVTCLKFYDIDDKPIETTERFTFDGDRFYWDIMINGDTISDQTASPNSKRLSYPDLHQNRHRIFCKNGDKYTRYYKTGKKAMVILGQPNTSQNASGPLGTGVIPWGYDMFSYQNLMQCKRIGWESWDNGKQEIHLQLSRTDVNPNFTMTFVLDREKDYAVLSYTLEDPHYSIIKQSYQDYVRIDGRWMPKIVTIERFKKTKTEPGLVSFEDVKFESIQPGKPANDSFKVEFSAGTLVELKPAGNAKSLLYYTTDKTAITNILEDKVELLFESDSENCATVAARYIAKEFSRSIPEDKLSGLISDETRKTSLYELKQVLEETGLHCNSVKIDLESLKTMQGGKAILHLSASNHYVILDHIDNNQVWYIDLISRKFYWKRDINDFLMEWKEGIALLVSDSPESIQIASSILPTEKLHRIRGGQYGNYACDEIIQPGGELECPEPVGILCSGAYYTFYERYGCREVDDPDSTCYGISMLGYDYYRCTNYNYSTNRCTVSPSSLSRDIRACD